MLELSLEGNKRSKGRTFQAEKTKVIKSKTTVKNKEFSKEICLTGA